MAETTTTKKKMDWGFLFLFFAIVIAGCTVSKMIGSYSEIDAAGQPTGKKFKYSLLNKKKK